MMTRIYRRIGFSTVAVAATALALAGASSPAAAGKKQAAAPPQAATANQAATGSTLLQDAGLRFESARLLGEADRAAGLEGALQITARAIQSGPGDERAAARFLSGEIRCGLGRYREAADEFRRAEDAFRKTPFADDAAFAAIQATEAAGNDAQAAKDWIEWEGRYPQSPLMGEARLAESWNALRRGDSNAAQKILAALTASRAWYAADSRVMLAQATALYQRGKPAEALAALGPKPSGAAAIYLRALCYRGSGSLLKAAAAFQDIADRYPDSNLRDYALLAKADAFLKAKDYRSAAEEFARAARQVRDDKVRAEAELRSAGAIYLSGQADSSLALLRGIVERRAGTDVAARAQFLVGESLIGKKMYAQAIVELNRVLTTYFQHSVAASAQYRVARCLDAMGRRSDATGTYQAVVSGYPLEPESPAAAYLAGVGLLSQNKPLAAAPYFQIVLGAAIRHTGAGLICTDLPYCRGALWPIGVHPAVHLHMLHRAVAFAVLALVSVNAFRLARASTGVVRALAWAGPVLVLAQIALGILTIVTFKDLLPVTAHLLVAALLLADLVSLLVLTRPAEARQPAREALGAPV